MWIASYVGKNSEFPDTYEKITNSVLGNTEILLWIPIKYFANNVCAVI